MYDMIYQSKRLNPPKRIAADEYKGFNYYVLSLGTHPCAYVDVTGTELDGVDYLEIDIDCHGGLTYSREYLNTVDKKGWFIGWDYAHYRDFVGGCFEYFDFCKKWTIEEIVSECEEVIDQLVELLKEGADND